MPLRFRHIFLMTYGRSGSTLLNGILNSIPGVCMRGENRNTLAFLCRAVESATYARRMSPPPDPSTHSWYGASLIDPDNFRRKLMAAFVEHILCPPEGVIAIGFKEIRYGIVDMSEQEYDSYVQLLLESFDRACIIFNVRRRRDVARSEWWLSEPFAEYHLRLCEARFNRSMRLHPDCTFQIEYDRYVQDPNELCSLFAFLGAEFDRAAIDSVLATTHSFRSSEDQIERFRAARSIIVSILESITRAVRRRLVGPD